MSRYYRYNEQNEILKEKLNKLCNYKDNIIILNIQTTGLEVSSDRIVQINAMKCTLTEKGLLPIADFHTYVNPDMEIPEEISKINGISNEDVATAPDISTAMEKTLEFCSSEPFIIGFNCDNFLIAMLKKAGFETGFMIYPKDNIDIIQLARMVLPKNNNLVSYSYKALSLYFELTFDLSDVLNGYMYLFNELYLLVPNGTENTKIKSVTYWEKSRSVKRLFIETTHGKISINALNGFLIEETPNYFDMVNLDELVKYLLKKCNKNDIFEVVRLYERTKIQK